ncbi:TPA: GNAT family N-acetyltransferase [Vibrio vulnificus]|nr:GNAT family N-acetyltransferase [Vibrio vulnificus]HAS6142467.1 GNAT family N-acetyltransferase [Vibrio vulnificus]HAS6164455.1 GNAT family N-acetyltransferase [Vibrio vulnificus]HAT7737906.1 GNAT family N-acetyltransferase [Vibrio vulnificus]HAU8258445.1 GNAT family N-acetyltransferase [Vibrio vulnificus]
MSPDFHIVTQRVTLRLIEAERASELARLIRRSTSLHQWIDWCHPNYSEKEAQSFLLMTRLNWVKADAYGFGIFLKGSDELVGMVAINELYHTFNMASLGYWIADDHQRHGLAKEAMWALAEFCFAKLKLTRLEIVCAIDNQASQKLIESCHAKQETIARNRFVFHDKPQDGVVYSLIPQDMH